MNVNDLFTPEGGAGFRWWADLTGWMKESDSGKEPDRARRAELRRCRDIHDVWLVPAYYDFEALFVDHDVHVRRENIAVLAGLLARVRQHVPGKLGAQMADTGDGSRAVVSGLRFRRLLKTEKPDAFFEQMRRVVQLLDRSLSVPALAYTVAYWHDDLSKAKHPVHTLARDYYTKARQEP